MCNAIRVRVFEKGLLDFGRVAVIFRINILGIVTRP